MQMFLFHAQPATMEESRETSPEGAAAAAGPLVSYVFRRRLLG